MPKFLYRATLGIFSFNLENLAQLDAWVGLIKGANPNLAGVAATVEAL